jgi:hypothetical protein
VARDPERFIALVCRELGAESARVLEPDPTGEGEAEPGDGAGAGEGETVLRSSMGGGCTVEVVFAAPPADRDAKKRRLEMLVAAFDAVVVEEHHTRRVRPSPATKLRDELDGLCARAGALNVIVVDANSPVVWGAAHPTGIVEVPPLPSSPNLAGVVVAASEASGEVGATDPAVAAASRKALRAVRAQPEIAALRKGKHLRYVQRSGDGPLVAHAFASIYLLIVVFEPNKVFDELRAERAIVESLPRVERLVMALPPHDPEPTQGAGVIAMRRPRRR